MKLQTMTVKAILWLGTDMFISRFNLQEREDFLVYSITFLKEITFQYMSLWGAIYFQRVTL